MKLSVTEGPSAGTIVAAEGERVVIGSDPGCDLTLDDPKVAPRHVEVTQRKDGGYRVTDLGSGRPTKIGGEDLDGSRDLDGGDTIEIGDSEVAVILEPEEPGVDDSPDAGTRQPLALHAAGGPGEGATILSSGIEMVIGSGADCDIVLEDDKVSERHASLRGLPDGRIEIEDLGSESGTFVSDRRISGPATLEGGEFVRIGGTVFTAGEPVLVEPAGVGDGEPIASARRSRVSRVVARRPRSRLAIVATVLSGAALVLAILAVTGVFSKDNPQPTGPPSTASIVDKVKPSTVLVIPDVDGQRVGNGSGWVYDAEKGLIVTNAHVVDAGTSFEVGVDGSIRDAEVVGVAPCEDLAVLKVDDTYGLKTLPLGSQETLRQGEPLYAVGYPGSASLSDNLQVTQGIVSVVDTPLDAIGKTDPDFQVYPSVVQTDAAINPGNSGGPSVNDHGRLIGVNTIAGGGQNQNYAIGVDRVKEVVPDLAKGDSLEWAGFSFLAVNVRSAHRGVLGVLEVIPGTSADTVGLKRRDLIINIDGQSVETRQDYCDALEDFDSGDDVQLVVVSPDGHEKAVKVALD